MRKNYILTLSFFLLISWLLYGNTSYAATVHIKAEIVDYKGNHVRDLTDKEASEVKFDIYRVGGITNLYGGEVGAFDNAGHRSELFPSPTTLGSYPNIPLDPHEIISSSGYRILNVAPPRGYVLRSIYSKSTCGFAGLGTKFIVRESGDQCSNTDVTIVLQFTSLGSSRMQKKDSVPFVDDNNSGLDFVKRLTQTYSDIEGLYLEPHDDFRAIKNIDGKRTFPTSYKIAVFNNKPYLFLNALSRIQIYDISDPLNPNLVEDFNIASNLPFKKFYDNNSYVKSNLGFVSPWPTIRAMYVIDNSPYIFLDLIFGACDIGSRRCSGMAILNLDTSQMKISFNEKLFALYSSNIKAFGQYRDSSGKIYFVGTLLPKSEVESNLFIKDSSFYQNYSNSIVPAIFSLNSDYSISVKKIIKSDNNIPSIANNISLIETIGGKTYIFVFPIHNTRDYYLKLIDITNPDNISVVSSINFTPTTAPVNVSIDSSKKRIYLILRNGSIDVFDISSPSLPQKLASYSNIFEFIKLSDSSPVIVELKKRLQIPQDTKIVGSPKLENWINSPPALSVSNGIATLMVGSLGMGINLPFDSTFTEYSDFDTSFFEFFVDVKDLNSPKILGMMLSRQILFSATGIGPLSIEYGVANCGYSDRFNRSFSIVYRDKYIYRANCRIADVWQFKNLKAGSPPLGVTQTITPTLSGSGTNTNKSNNTLNPLSTFRIFNLDSLLRIFKRAKTGF
jgi:hypothetical protein